MKIFVLYFPPWLLKSSAVTLGNTMEVLLLSTGKTRDISGCIQAESEVKCTQNLGTLVQNHDPGNLLLAFPAAGAACARQTLNPQC